MNSIRILLVDDNVSARALLAAFVEQTPGLELCGEAGDGWQGLELTGRLRPDLVLLDLIMPGLDGIGFLEGLAGLSGGWRPRVIVLSGVSTDAYVQHSCRLGADYYLVKPVNLRQLAGRISALFPPGESRQEYGPAGWLLNRLGADSRLDGCAQTAFALELMAAAEGQVQMKEIYLSTAQAFHTTAACVETPRAYSLMAALPEALRSVLQVMVKYTATIPRAAETGASTVSATLEYLTLPAAYEVSGRRSALHPAEEYSYQKQYDYFAQGVFGGSVADQGGNAGRYFWTRTINRSDRTVYQLYASPTDTIEQSMTCSYGILAVCKV